MVSDAVLVALIGGGVTVLGMTGHAGYVLYRGWTSRRKTRHVAVSTLAAKDQEIAALKAEVRVQKRTIAYLRKALDQCWQHH